MKAQMSARQKKELYFVKLHQILEDYSKLFIADIKHVSSKQVADIRKSLRGQAILLFGKKTMIRSCIRKFVDEHPGHPIEKILDMVHGNIGLIFVNGDMAKVREIILANKVPAPARIGVLAPVDVIVPAGPTGCDPGQTSFFQALNIATKINKSQIEIINPVPLLAKGDKVNPGQAALLDKLNIHPFSYGMHIRHVYDDGAIYDPVVLDLTEKDIMEKFFNGVNKLAALSLAVGYPTLASRRRSRSRLSLPTLRRSPWLLLPLRLLLRLPLRKRRRRKRRRKRTLICLEAVSSVTMTTTGKRHEVCHTRVCLLKKEGWREEKSDNDVIRTRAGKSHQLSRLTP